MTIPGSMAMRGRLSLAIVLPSFYPAVRYGGPILATRSLAAAVAREGWSVQVFTSDADGPTTRLSVPRSATLDGFRVHYLRRLALGEETLAPALGAALLTASPRPSVLHVAPPFASSTLQALLVGEVCRIPVVLSPRGSFEAWSLGQKPFKKRVALAALNPLLRRVAGFHATSEAEAAATRKIVPEANVRVIPNGVDMPSDVCMPVAGGPPVILSLGRIHVKKALERLLEAAALLHAEGLVFRVAIVGPGEAGYLRSLQNLAERLGVHALVDWREFVDSSEKWRTFAQARVFALPSHSENFGNVVLEALACGRPVVASVNTPWSELERQRCGRWVPNDARSLADALRPYLADATLAQVAGERGRELVRLKYSWSSVARDMVSFYESAIERQRMLIGGNA